MGTKKCPWPLQELGGACSSLIPALPSEESSNLTALAITMEDFKQQHRALLRPPWCVEPQAHHSLGFAIYY